MVELLEGQVVLMFTSLTSSISNLEWGDREVSRHGVGLILFEGMRDLVVEVQM